MIAVLPLLKKKKYLQLLFECMSPCTILHNTEYFYSNNIEQILMQNCNQSYQLVLFGEVPLYVTFTVPRVDP